MVGGYVTGIGTARIHSSINLVAFVANAVANVLLIPPFGILGAALHR